MTWTRCFWRIYLVLRRSRWSQFRYATVPAAEVTSCCATIWALCSVLLYAFPSIDVVWFVGAVSNASSVPPLGQRSCSRSKMDPPLGLMIHYWKIWVCGADALGKVPPLGLMGWLVIIVILMIGVIVIGVVGIIGVVLPIIVPIAVALFIIIMVLHFVTIVLVVILRD